MLNIKSSSLKSSISISFYFEADSINDAAFLSIEILGTFPLASVPPMMKNFLMSDDTATRFLILFSEIASGLAAYFSGLKQTKIALRLFSPYMAFSFSLSYSSSTMQKVCFYRLYSFQFSAYSSKVMFLCSSSTPQPRAYMISSTVLQILKFFLLESVSCYLNYFYICFRKS